MAGVRTPLRQFASCVLVDSDDTLDSIFSSDMAIENMLHKELVLELTQEEYEDLVQESVVGKSNTLESYLSLKSSKQQYEAVLKMGSEVEVQQYISQSGIKKSKTLLSSKITKARKITELGS